MRAADGADRGMRLTAGLAGLTGLATVVVYVTIIVSQGGDSLGEIAPWVAAMLVPATLALLATIVSVRSARWCLLLAAVLFLPFVLTSLAPGFLLAAGISLAGAAQAHALARG